MVGSLFVLAHEVAYLIGPSSSGGGDSAAVSMADFRETVGCSWLQGKVTKQDTVKPTRCSRQLSGCGRCSQADWWPPDLQLTLFPSALQGSNMRFSLPLPKHPHSFWLHVPVLFNHGNLRCFSLVPCDHRIKRKGTSDWRYLLSFGAFEKATRTGRTEEQEHECSSKIWPTCFWDWKVE
jgi:hypothetical protein